MSRVEDLRAKASRYRAMRKYITDPRSLDAMQELAAELERKADALQQEERCCDSSTPD